MARNFGHLRGGALISDSARECSLHVGNAKHYQNGDETLFSLCWVFSDLNKLSCADFYVQNSRKKEKR